MECGYSSTYSHTASSTEKEMTQSLLEMSRTRLVSSAADCDIKTLMSITSLERVQKDARINLGTRSEHPTA